MPAIVRIVRGHRPLLLNGSDAGVWEQEENQFNSIQHFSTGTTPKGACRDLR